MFCFSANFIGGCDEIVRQGLWEWRVSLEHRMESFSARCLLWVAFGAFVLLYLPQGQAQAVSAKVFPKNRATGVNPDTHLVLTFSTPPMIGKSGHIRVYEAGDHREVDDLDLSIPAGPDPTHRIAAVPAQAIDPNPATPTTTTPAVRTTPADLHNYQLTTIGGLADFHFYPIIVHGSVATIYLHNNSLHYGHRYVVQIDSGVFTFSSASFKGITTPGAWTFTTKAAPPPADATRLVVAADGSGDFSTIQGAVNFVPDNPSKRITIFIKNGTYEEIVFFRKKTNLTFLGEDRDKVQVGYGNNSAFNPPVPGPSRRCAFSVYDSTGIELSNFSITNHYHGQAEGLLVFGSKNIVSHMNITGSGDALNLRGPVYLKDTRIVGEGDTILGVGPAFFDHCEIESSGPFMWIRNTEANHGNVFLDCSFIARPRRTSSQAAPPATPQTQTSNPASLASTQGGTPMGAVFARLPNNHGLNYPYAEAVLINCRLRGIPPIGWGPIDGDTSHLHLWEFNSRDLDGHPIDVSQRHPASRQLSAARDAKTIAQYSDPAFVLGGWAPSGR
jgi:pectinesterase